MDQRAVLAEAGHQPADPVDGQRAEQHHERGRARDHPAADAEGDQRPKRDQLGVVVVASMGAIVHGRVPGRGDVVVALSVSVIVDMVEVVAVAGVMP